MGKRLLKGTIVAVVWLLSGTVAPCQSWPWIEPEKREIKVREPGEFAQVSVPDLPAPQTVSDAPIPQQQWQISLNEVIRMALENARVIRILNGLSASSSGATIYDPAISHTTIDQNTAQFNPSLQVSEAFNRSESPGAAFDPSDPTQAIITGGRGDTSRFNLGLSQPNVSGGTWNLGVNSNPSRFRPGTYPLNPQTGSAVELSYTQPLLQGRGRDVNRVPIVIASIDTERSFFQFKDRIQEMVRSVIAGYWSLVAARTTVWARQQQVDMAAEYLEYVQAQRRVGNNEQIDVAQATSLAATLRAGLIGAQADLLLRESALRNVLGLPPQDERLIVPTTTLTTERRDILWKPLLELAQTNRPDLIELKLILEADQQRLLLNKNRALPRVDTMAMYRWNGISGEMPNGAQLSSAAGQFTDWTLSINFSVPLGLRRERAQIRQTELLLLRDRENLQQGIHAMSHNLAISVRNLAQLYEQYQISRRLRQAAADTLEQVEAESRLGIVLPYLQFRTAIGDWGNAIAQESASLANYHTELATLERQTGTILETHGIRFVEEQFQQAGPLSCYFGEVAYPSALRPATNTNRYTPGDRPAELEFDLKDPWRQSAEPEPVPPVNEGTGTPRLRRLPAVTPDNLRSFIQARRERTDRSTSKTGDNFRGVR